MGEFIGLALLKGGFEFRRQRGALLLSRLADRAKPLKAQEEFREEYCKLDLLSSSPSSAAVQSANTFGRLKSSIAGILHLAAVRRKNRPKIRSANSPLKPRPLWLAEKIQFSCRAALQRAP